MKCFQYFACAALSILFLTACSQETPEPSDPVEYPYSLSVWNQDYTEEFALEKMGLVELSSVEAIPSWIDGLTLSQDTDKGVTFASIDVKRTEDLESEQEADVLLKMTNGATATLHLVQWPDDPADNTPVKSINTAFEKDWANAKTITLVLETVNLNGRPEIKTEEVYLPWTSNSAHHLPSGDIDQMLDQREDWRMVFNLTGVETLPKRHFFALYNRYSGVLRVFYYWHGDDIPTDGNDHLWSFELDATVSEHQSTQFAVPYEETATGAYKNYAAAPVLITPYASRADEREGGKHLPSVGWWAFDVNMAAARPHDFFSESPRGYTAKIAANLYNEDNVMMNSLLKGNLNGALDGAIDLSGLYSPGTSGWGTATNCVLSSFGGMFSSMYFLQGAFGNPTTAERSNLNSGVGMAFFGAALSAVGKVAEKEWDDGSSAPAELGKLNAKINLDLNATMTTEGIIGGARATTIPPTTMEMANFWPTTADGKPTSFGEGVWNIRKHPVVYVVTDAYWHENDFSVIRTGVAYRKNKRDYSYYITGGDPDRPGLRIVSFLDPTSVEGIYLNDILFDQGITACHVELVYGVYPSSKEGYTNDFRRTLGLNTDLGWKFTSKSSFNTKYSKDLDFKLSKKSREDAIFGHSEIAPELTDYVAYRRSEQTIADSISRRFYGPSMFYTKEFADPYQVDVVHFVSDPQVDVPFDSNDKRIIDPQAPDFIVTAVLRLEGMDRGDDDNQIMVNTLRFVPEVKFITRSQLESVYNEIASRKMVNITGKPIKVEWIFKDEQIKKIENFKDALK